MFINDVHIAYYIGAIILSIFVGQLVDWMCKRLPNREKVFSLDIFKEYKNKFKPNYILILIVALIYRAYICIWSTRYNSC